MTVPKLLATRDYVDTTVAAGGNFYGAFASRPTAGVAGAIATYSDVGALQQVDDGTKWRNLIWNRAYDAPPPAASLTTQANFSTSTITDNASALLFTPAVTDPSTPRTRFAGVPIVTLSEAAATCIVEFQVASHNAGFGVSMRESSSGKLVYFGLNVVPSGTKTSLERLSYTSETGAYTGTGAVFPVSQDIYNGLVPRQSPLRLRMRVSGSNLVLEFDRGFGAGWQAYETLALTTYFTTAPTHVGVGCYIQTGTAVSCNYTHLSFAGV